MIEWLFILFAWSLFIIGRVFKDYPLTAVSGIMIMVTGVYSLSIFPTDNLLFTIPLVSIGMGFYILIRSSLDNIEPWILKLKKKKEDKHANTKIAKKSS